MKKAAYELSKWLSAAFTTRGLVDENLHRVTFCCLVLENGFVVTGQSACVLLEDFDVELGQAAAKDRAISQVFDLLAYGARSV